MDKDEQDRVSLASQFWFGQEPELLQPNTRKSGRGFFIRKSALHSASRLSHTLLVNSLPIFISLAFQYQFQVTRILIAIL